MRFGVFLAVCSVVMIAQAGLAYAEEPGNVEDGTAPVVQPVPSVQNDTADPAPTMQDQGQNFDGQVIDRGHGGGGGGHGGGWHGGGGHGGGWHGGHGGGWHGPGHGPGHGWGPGRPYPIHGGIYPWRHWPHPIFWRPVYYWNWGGLVAVTCSAEDSEGNDYPVTEDGYAGYGYEPVLPNIEDAALDRCYSETGGDTGCHFAGCTPEY